MKEIEGDLALLERWRSGDKLANSELLSRYYKTLHRFFANKVSGDVDDLVQQTMLALLGCQDRFEQRSSFRAYLLSVARYQLYEYYRRSKRARGLLEYDSVSAFDLAPSPSLQVAQRHEQALLLMALRRIPVNLQIALELHYWEEMSGPEVAEVLGVPVDTAYSRLKKARELVRKQMHLLTLLGSSPTPDIDLETVERELTASKSLS